MEEIRDVTATIACGVLFRDVNLFNMYLALLVT